MFQEFPYTDMHQLNLDWIIKIAKDFLDQYTHIQDLIAQGEEDITNLSAEKLQALQEKATELEALLQAWYNTHSEDIATQLANALSSISQELTAAVNAFDTHAESKAQTTIDSIPADYTALSNAVVFIRNAMEGNNILSALSMEFGFVQSSDGSLYEGGSVYKYTPMLPVKPGDRFFYNVYGSTSTVTVAAYETAEDTNAILNKSVIGLSQMDKNIYTVPDGVNYVRFTANINDPMAVFYLIDNRYEHTITEGDFNTFQPSTAPYMIVSGNNYSHAPTRAAGTLYCYEDYLYGLIYQIFIENHTSNIYTRLKASGTWRDWISSEYNLNNITLKVAGNNLIDLSTQPYGFVQSSDGSLYVGGDVYKYSELIPVSAGQKYKVWGYGSAGVLVVAAYENNYSNAIVNKSLQGSNANISPAGHIYTVPDGIHYIRISVTKYVDATLELVTEKELKKEVSILFVGNSLTQDGIAYLPYMLHTFHPEILFRIYIWYNGGYTLNDQYTKFTGNGAAEIFSMAEYTPTWYNRLNSVTIDDVLSTYKIDIVCMQEYFNYKSEYTSADLDDWNNCQNYIAGHYTGGNPLEFITLFPAPKRDIATSVFNLTKTGIASILKNTTAQDMIPMGISIYRAMSTSLDSLGDQGHLSVDGTHAQEGLPCLMQTQCVLCWLFEKLGINKSIYGDTFKMTQTIYGSIDVPGANPGTGVIEGSTAQNLLSQEVAIKAYKEGKQFTILNLSDNN